MCNLHIEGPEDLINFVSLLTYTFLNLGYPAPLKGLVTLHSVAYPHFCVRFCFAARTIKRTAVLKSAIPKSIFLSAASKYNIGDKELLSHGCPVLSLPAQEGEKVKK